LPRERGPQVHDATFVAETRTLASLPPVGPPEVAISGRSNVGKSTLLNRLAGRHKLARTSKTPGRTRGMVFYDLRIGGGAGDAFAARALRLADLPGFGYARVSQVERASWQPLIEGYVERRPTLALFVVLVDARRGVAAEEAQLVEWLASLLVPVQLVFTKTDKLSGRERGALLASVRGGGPARRALLVSGETGDGVDELWAAIVRALPDAAPVVAAEIADLKPPA
jgi:GTP-binding protein